MGGPVSPNRGVFPKFFFTVGYFGYTHLHTSIHKLFVLYFYEIYIFLLESLGILFSQYLFFLHVKFLYFFAIY